MRNPRNWNQPLGLSKGSVRAILALEVVTAFVVLAVAATAYALVNGSLDATVVFAALVGLVGPIVGWYFAKADNA